VRNSSVVAAIDVGTNTTRLLVARVAEGRLRPLASATEMTALGTGLGRDGRIGEAALDRAEEVVAAMAADARRVGAERLVLAATAIGRDAANSGALLARLARAAGVAPRVLSGDEEAALAFRGLVASGAPDPLLACDLGGGSLEVMGGEGGRLAWAVSLPLGSRRLTERFALTDPPALGAASDLIGAALAELEPAASGHVAGGGVATGGSSAALARLTDSPVLDEVALRLALERTAAAPAASVAAERGLPDARVRVLFAAACVFEAVRRAFRLDGLAVSEAGVKEGLVLEAASG
jgi:exopolyphosphatase/guanosine-5'-triphosphate,3'-diphosphate pyrophosphatase